MQGNESLHHLDRKLSIFTYRGYGRRNSGDPPLKTEKNIDPFAPLDQNGTKRTTINFTVLSADMVLKKEAPPGKNSKKESMFAVFTADMLKEKGAPRPVLKKRENNVYRFYRGYGRRKRSAPR